MVIHLTDKSAKAEHYDWFYIYNTYKPSVLFQKKIEYFGTETLADYFLIGSHYLRYKTYYIPELSKNELLKYNYAISYYPYMFYSDKADIKIYKNEISADPYHTDSYSFLAKSEAENIIELEAGFSYYILITHSVINYYHYREEIMFQLIPAKVQRIYEGHPVALTTFGYRYLFFYLDVTMFDDEYFYFKIYTSGDELRDLIPKELESNNYDYIVSQTSDLPSKTCEKRADVIDLKVTYFYKCQRLNGKNTKAILFAMKHSSDPGSLPTIYVEYIPRYQISEPNNIKKIFKSGQIGYYVFNLKKLSYYNYNVLLYTNSPNAMTVNIFDYEPVYSYQYKNVYRNVRLFFIDPMKPEYESFNQDKLAEYYTIFLFQPYSEEYSLDIKFINNNIQFSRELNAITKSYVKKMIYNGSKQGENHIYYIKSYSVNNYDRIYDYFVTYQPIYGNYEAEMIDLSELKCNYITDFINRDNSLNKKYALDLNKPTQLQANVLIHIKIKNSKIFYGDQLFVSFYKNILKYMGGENFTLNKGQQERFLIKPGESKYIYFDYSESEFNFEIKFLGSIDSNSTDYVIKIKACNINNALILDSQNNVIRGKCTDVSANTEIALTSESNKIVGIIVKRALHLGSIDNIIKETKSNIDIINKVILIQFDKSEKNALFYNTTLSINKIDNLISIYEEYSDINYISYPPNYLKSEDITDFSSYNNLIYEYNTIYDESVQEKIKEADNFFLIIVSNNRYSELNFIKRLKNDISQYEKKDFVISTKNNGDFFVLPKKSDTNNYDTLFLQIFKNENIKQYYSLYYDFKKYETFIIYERKYEYLNTFNLKEISDNYMVSITTDITTNSILRYALYNSQQGEYKNYNYENSLITSTYIGLKPLESTKIYAAVKINFSPHESNGCSNYYFFIINPNYTIDIKTYYDFRNTNLDKYYLHTITAKNICSINNIIMDDDLDKFIFELKWNKSSTIQIFGYSEQVGLFKAIKFYPTLSIEFKYDVYIFHNVVLNMDEDKIFYLDENEQDRVKFNITYNDEGSLNLYWRGSNENYLQKLYIYGNDYKGPCIFDSTRISYSEHNYTLDNITHNSYNYIIYESVDDKMDKIFYFSLTHKLGKKFDFNDNNNINNKWKVYTSGIYKFYTEIKSDDILKKNNKLNIFRFKYNQNNNTYIIHLKLYYLDNSQNIIKTIEKKDDFCIKLDNNITSNYCYFTLNNDELSSLIKDKNLNYIQIEFKIKFLYGQTSVEYEELSMERIYANEIKSNFYKKLDELINEHNDDLGIYYIDVHESILSPNINLMFYTNGKKISEMPMLIYTGNYLDFNLDIFDREKINKIDKSLYVFNSENIPYYQQNSENIILILVGKNGKNNYSDKFIEFKEFDKEKFDIHFNMVDDREKNQQKEKIFSFDTGTECAKIIYYITYYNTTQRKFCYFDKIKGNIDINYINNKSIFSGNIEEINDILPDKKNLSINEHPNEIFEGNLDIVSIKCKSVPSSAKLYSMNDSSIVTFSEQKNKFIGSVYIHSKYQLTKKFEFNLKNKENFKYQMRIIKLTGYFEDKVIQYKLQEKDDYKELNEHSIIVSNSPNSSFDTPIIKINENSIGNGVLFIEFIKGIEGDSFKYFNQNVFEHDISQSCYTILNYNDIDFKTEKVNLIFNNTNSKNDIICLTEVYGQYPYLEIPTECKRYQIASKQIYTITINNPYKSTKNLFSNENNNYNIFFNSTLSSKFSFIYVYNRIELQEKITKNIYNFGETQIELKNNNSKYNNILYQINNCNKNKYSRYNIGSQSQTQYADQDAYDILLNYKSNNLASFIIEGKKYDDNEMLKFIYAETEYNSIDSLINKNAYFNYILNKDNIEKNQYIML